MQTTVAIGDIHGRTNWKAIVAKHPDAHVVFIGDYFDTKTDITAAEQIANYLEICDFKRRNASKTTLLIGNHDYHYLQGVTEHYAGYQKGASIAIQTAIESNLDIMQVCYHDETSRILFSHAGVSQKWLKAVGLDDMIHIQDTCDSINELFNHNRKYFEFNRIDKSGYGNHSNQGPLWIRPDKLKGHGIEYFQVVGHTPCDAITLTNYDHSPSLGFFDIDCLGHKEYLIVNSVTEDNGGVNVDFKVKVIAD